jgi:predicted peptidase
MASNLAHASGTMTPTCVLLIVALTLPQRPAHPTVVRQFHEMTFQHADESQRARLYVPASSTDRPLPLVIWFHGRGEAGNDNRSQLAWLELIFGSGRVEAIVLAVQAPLDQANWTSGGWQDSDPLSRVDAAYDHVLRYHAIDKQRIYLAGISQGASTCWHYARRHPGRFAAALPLATCQVNDQALSELAGLSVWAFQSTADGAAQLSRMRQLIARCKAAGVRARLTAVPGLSHDCWTSALTEYGAWRWLLRQRQGADTTHGVMRRTGSGLAVLLALIIARRWYRSKRPGAATGADRPGNELPSTN